MNALHRGKHVYTDRNIPHFVDDPKSATHRYLSGKQWRYMEARQNDDFLRWSAGWMEPTHRPQRKIAGLWRDM